MTCPHAETTTLLWIYGEGEPEHLEHILSCEECQAVVALHSDVQAAVGPVLIEDPPAIEMRPANQPWRWAAILAAAAVAAVAFMVISPATERPTDGPSPPVQQELFADLGELLEDPVDQELDDLWLELETM